MPSPRVKSPPWHMNPGMMRWNVEPLKCSFLPERPLPFSPVHSARKFAAVLGTTSAKSLNSIRPAAWPPMVMSMKTTLGSPPAAEGASRLPREEGLAGGLDAPALALAASSFSLQLLWMVALSLFSFSPQTRQYPRFIVLARATTAIRQSRAGLEGGGGGHKGPGLLHRNWLQPHLPPRSSLLSVQCSGLRYLCPPSES